MASGIIRAAIVGASSLLGKELAEELNEAVVVQWDIKLLDSPEAAGQITAAGDEPLIIQSVDADSFVGIEIAFFTGEAVSTLQYWRDAVKAGASVVDLTGALEGEDNVSVRSPLVRAKEKKAALDLTSVAVVSAHPAAVMLGSLLSKLGMAFAPIQASATLLEPASQQGSAGLDEMHAQTVSLLSFKPLPQAIFDAQVAFNLSAELGSSAQADLTQTSRTIRKHLEAIAGTPLSKSTAMQLVQAPVFSGYTASVFIATTSDLKTEEIERALAGDIVSIAAVDDPSPSNQSVTQQNQIQVRVHASSVEGPTGFWLWIAADNLRLAARNAVACAAELLALRPGTRLQ